MVTQAVVQLGSHLAFESFTHVVIVDVTIDYRGLSCPDDAEKTRVLIPIRARDDEGRLHISLGGHALGQTIAGRTETSENMGGELPPEHQCFHSYLIMGRVCVS